MKTGLLVPPPWLVELSDSIGDETFTRIPSDEDLQRIVPLLPKVRGWEPDMSTAIFVKLPYSCSPHEDDWMGDGRVREHRSLFWFMSTNGDDGYIFADGRWVLATNHEWFFFDDSRTHAVMMNYGFHGLAIQYSREEK